MNAIVRVVASMCEKAFPSVPTFRLDSRGRRFPDCQFLLIRRKDFCAGLFSYVVTTLDWIRYADENGLVPVVDMAYHKNIYQTWFDFLFRRLNSWELFFSQPMGVRPFDIVRAARVFVADGVAPGGADIRGIIYDENKLSQYRELAKKYLRPNYAELQRYDNPVLNEALQVGVVGVIARGTDFVAMRPRGHAIQPTVDEIILEVNKCLADGRNNWRVFLVTEDPSIAERFRGEYGDRLISPVQEFVRYEGGLLAQNKSVAHNKERGLAYLKAIMDLSRCDCLFAGINNGTAGAMILSRGFQASRIFDHGDYV